MGNWGNIMVENEAMAIKIICIQNGIPLWSSTYPENKTEEDTLISGFLSAINSFAKMTEGKTIKNMTIGNSLWTFVNVHGIEDLFITSEIDIIGEIESKNYKIRLIEQLVSEISEEFSRSFPPESMINNNDGAMTRYSAIQAYAARKTKTYYDVMARYEKHDIKWLASFKESERLFTAIMDNLPIYVIGESLKNSSLPSEVVQLQATVEFISGHPVEYRQFSSVDRIPLDNERLELFICTSRDDLSKNLPGSTPIVDIDFKSVVNGPEPNSIAIRTVNFIRNHSENKQRDTNVISNLLSRDDNQDPNLRRLIPGNQPILTEFNCKLCNTPIRFHIDDDSSYLDKQSHQSFFGLDLATYRVAHVSRDQMHINSALVDDKGLFHSLIEAFAIPLYEASKIKVGSSPGEISITKARVEPLRQHSSIDTMYIMDLEKMTMIELICPSVIKSVEIGRIIVDKLHEIFRVYSDPPRKASVLVADKKYEIWISGSIVFALSFKKQDYVNEFENFMDKLVELKYKGQAWSSKHERLLLALKYTEKTKITKQIAQAMVRIVSDDLIFSKIQAKYPDQVPRIMDKLSTEFQIPKEVISPLLMGRSSVIDLLRGDYLSRAQELFQLVDFMTRRKILL